MGIRITNSVFFVCFFIWNLCAEIFFSKITRRNERTKEVKMTGFLYNIYHIHVVLILDSNSWNRCACREQSLLFDLCKSFDKFESSHKSDIFYPKRPIFLHACATGSELTSNIIIMIISKNHWVTFCTFLFSLFV